MVFDLITEEGLSREEVRLVRNYLLIFNIVTGHEWRPRNCTVIPSLASEASRAYTEVGLNRYFQPPEPQRFFHSHFFLIHRGLANEQRVFIVDPTGVPKDWPNLESEIVPYFGLLESAPAPHQKVYSRHEPMDSWGTREFPPGFHP